MDEDHGRIVCLCRRDHVWFPIFGSHYGISSFTSLMPRLFIYRLGLRRTYVSDFSEPDCPRWIADHMHFLLAFDFFSCKASSCLLITLKTPDRS